MLDIKTYKPEIFPDLIERIWIVENNDEANDLMVPPNQYLNVIFPLNNSKYSYNGKWISKPQIEGLTLQTTRLHYPKKTKLIGIRFYPYGLHSFINISGKQIFNNTIDLLPLLKEIPDINNSNEPIDKVKTLLSSLFNEKKYEKSDLIRDYYQYFRGTQSTISIEEYCKINDTNYTSLNRLFTKIIGLSPKRFERLIKFRKSLCSLIDSPENLTIIGADSGYFDQAHFIREFKLFLRVTPSTYHGLIKSADKESNIINYNFRLF